MSMKKIPPILAFLVLFTGTAHADKKLDFSLGAGFPFAIAELSYIPDESDYRYYMNVKYSIESGAAIGVEHTILDDRKHAIGGLIGTIGLAKGNGCDEEPSSIGEAIGCGIVTAFDWEVINGIGVTYSYNFTGLQNNGWHIRFEGGYGKGSESTEKKWSSDILISYQF